MTPKKRSTYVSEQITELTMNTNVQNILCAGVFANLIGEALEKISNKRNHHIYKQCCFKCENFHFSSIIFSVELKWKETQ